MKNCNHLLGSLCDENIYINDFKEKVYDISETQKNLSKYSFLKNKPDSPKEIVDGRKGYLFRFKFCPYCGERLNWKEIISEIK